LDAPAGLVCYSLLGYVQYNKKNYDQGKQDLHGSLDFINKHLADKTFLVGERITLADISVACSLLLPFKMVLDPATRAKFQNVTRWFTTLINQPQFIAVLGEVVLAAQEQQPGGAAAAAAPKKEEKKKEEKPKEAPKPKEEKKKAAKEDDDDDEPAAKEEKPRLSEEETAWIAKKSPMDLENVKRLFSNNKFEDIINQFWTEFDHSTFTIYECCYNYNEDNTIEWLTANLMGGFIQRLEEARKVSYGTITMAGNKPFYVQGVFMFKYKEVPTFVKECPDYESYTFKPLDATTDAGKQRFAEIWNGPTIDGRELKERRQFK
jgi:elongation factor 1-gamma